SVLLRNAIEHAGGVEGARHRAGPLLELEQPAQQDGIALVRVHEHAIFRARAHAVGVTIGHKAAVATLAHYGLLQRAHVGLDGLRIDAGEQRVHLAAYLDARHTDLAKDIGQDVAPGAVHAIHRDL